ncbi:universal stress protein [Deefgea rivuli]|uniref:universal stress protein n=1 Tax=Deefgea rivuli TaxID=400948 RepID=UPI0004890CD9|nr:universal stress protein [Deefgea rivuli]
MYLRILVPIDHSEAATAAFGHALELAKLMNSTLHLVHVENIARSSIAAGVIPGFEFPAYNEQRETNIQHSQALLNRLAEVASQQEVKCTTRLIEEWGGNPADTLLNAANAFNADLIVMGTHGYSGFMQLIFGSISESLLHKSRVPVLLIRKDEDHDE